MSQLETIMLVALGFVLAALVALFLGKAAWNVAYRLGARRTRKQIPANLMELQTERDRLRAEHAMLQRRSEVEAERIKAKSVEQTAEVMRNRNRIALLGQDLDRRDKLIADQEAAIKALQEQVTVIEAELAHRTEVISDLERQVERWQAAAASVMPGDMAHSEPVRGFSGEPVLRVDKRRQEPLPADPDPDLAMTQHRLSRRIRDLTRITEQFRSGARSDQAHPGVPEIRPGPVPLRPMTGHGWETQDQLPSAPVESRHETILREPDQWLNDSTQQGAGSRQPETEGEQAASAGTLSPSIANVVSLAQRLRSLKKDFGN